MITYPLMGLAIGRRYPAMPTFGLPCPVTIFTVGALLLTPLPVPRFVFVAPAVWGLLGGASATLLLGVGCRPPLRRHHRRDGLRGGNASEQLRWRKPAGHRAQILLAIGAIGSGHPKD